MSDRLRELLDEAVANVTPSRPDPVADVLRRAQGRRRRTATAAALIVALTVIGIVTTVALVPVKRGPGVIAGTTDPSVPPSNSPTAISLSTPPAISPTTIAPGPVRPNSDTPQVVAGRVVSGGLSFPIPTGGRCATDPLPMTACRPRRSPSVGGLSMTGGVCWIGSFQSASLIFHVCARFRTRPAPATHELILPGGQPAWLGMGGHTSDDPFGTQPGPRTVQILVPWSFTFIELNLDYDDLMTFLATVQTTPVAPSPMVLHEDAVSAYFVPPTTESAVNVLFLPPPNLSDPRVEPLPAMKVLQRLKSLTDVVPTGQECATVDTAAAAIYLFPSDGAMGGNDLVVITDSESCSQAMSYMGGRVWVPRALLDELRSLFLAPAQQSGRGG